MASGKVTYSLSASDHNVTFDWQASTQTRIRNRAQQGLRVRRGVMPSSESEPQYEWVDVDPDELEGGDMVRGLGNGHFGRATAEGYVRDVNDEYVYLTGSDFGGWDRGRQWQRRVPAPEPTGWVHVTDLSTLRVGDVVRATPNGIGGRLQARVTTVDPSGDGYTAFTTHVITPTRNGEERDRAGYDADGYMYGGGDHNTELGQGEGEAPGLPLPQVVLAAPRVGDRFTRVFDHAGYADRAGCVVCTVRSVDPRRAQLGWAITYDDANGRYWHDELLVRPDGTCSPSVPSSPDTGGRYVPEVATEVFNPFGDLPFGVVAHDSGASAGAERALPSWATSLDAARRYVHEQAIDLWRAEHNCWDGTRDFLDALDLPTEKDWPEADESAEIRNFLTEVREAALAQAEDHGKDSDQVRAWLREHGIVPAPPALVQHEFRVQTPVGVNVRQILLDLGWVVQD